MPPTSASPGSRFSALTIPGADNATLTVLGDSNTFDGVDVDTKNASTRQGIFAGGDNNTFKNGSTYNVIDEKAALVSGTNVTFDNYDFHDVLVTDELVAQRMRLLRRPEPDGQEQPLLELRDDGSLHHPR